MEGKRIAYKRCSSIDQNIERQTEILSKYDIDKNFEEKISGKNTNRPQLQAMLEYVREGDTVYIVDFSRLARNVKDLLDIVETLNNKGVKLVSVKENLDTATPQGKLMLTMLGAIYEFERAMILERQREGIALAKKRGVYKGRKPVVLPNNYDEVMDKWSKREINSKKAMQLLGLKSTKFYEFLKEYKAKKSESQY